jgi:uncharacterized protein (DUF1015 family)
MAANVACVPYDVVDDDEVREYVGENPLSFLRVTRPEAELAEKDRETAVYAFQRARENLRNLIDEKILINDTEPSLYAYRLKNGSHEQTGVVACCSLDEYEKGLIKKHKNTRPDKVKNRTGHLLTLRAQTGLILLAYRGTETIRALTAEATETEPLYDFCAGDGVRHTIWRIAAAEPWIEAFGNVRCLYIADGHHRIESADVARKRILAADENLPGGNEIDFVMAGIFPAEELRILAYNRAVRSLNGLSDEEFLEEIKNQFFIVSEAEYKEPKSHGEICMYASGKWYKLFFNMRYFREPDPIERLDVSILQDNILGPILGLDDPRTDERIIFVGGSRGTQELERLVDTGEAAAAFSLFPTRMDDLLAVSDGGEIMPPKSTWFEPKLKDGLLIHQF